MNKAVCCFVKATGWLPYILINRPRYYYEDKNVQGKKIKGGAMIVANHHSMWDFTAMMYAFPSRNLRCLVSELIYAKGKFVRGLLKGLGAIRVDRDLLNFSFIDQSCQILKNNGVIEIYPEARLPKDGEEKPLPFKTSVAYIAINSEAPIIPVVTNGGVWKGKRMRVLIGKPIQIESLLEKDKSEKENIEIITNKLRNKIIELNNELENRTKEEKKK